MKTQFSIKVRGNSLLIELDSQQREGQTFVITNEFRPSICTEHPINQSSPIAQTFMGNQFLLLKEEFEADLLNQVNFINESQEELNCQLFYDACCMACDQHISRCGRLFISDMFTYLDIFTVLFNAYSRDSKQETTQLYLQCTKILGHWLNQYVKCPGPFGNMMDFDTWARINNI